MCAVDEGKGVAAALGRRCAEDRDAGTRHEDKAMG